MRLGEKYGAQWQWVELCFVNQTINSSHISCLCFMVSPAFQEIADLTQGVEATPEITVV